MVYCSSVVSEQLYAVMRCCVLVNAVIEGGG